MAIRYSLENVRDTIPRPIAAERSVMEFFAGIGLMRMGLEQAGWRVVYANDIAEDKFEMYSAQFPDAASHFSIKDIHTISAEELPVASLATASFPCNDLSLAGMRRGLEGQQSSAFWGFTRLLEELGENRPPIVLLENVAGFLTSHGGRDFHTAMTTLNQLGYVVDPLIIDAARFVPQSRVRLFVVAHTPNIKHAMTVCDTPGFFESDVRPKPLADFIFCHPDIHWSIRPLPQLPARTTSLKDIVEDVPDDSPLWWNTVRRDYLVNQMSERHSAQLRAMMKADSWSYGTVFRRVRNGRSMAELRNDGLAGCLRTPRGGSGRQILLQAGYGQVKVRLLTPRECARLMGADDFRITVSQNPALFGFGDAVCVPVVAWIANHYLNPLADELAQPPAY